MIGVVVAELARLDQRAGIRDAHQLAAELDEFRRLRLEPGEIVLAFHAHQSTPLADDVADHGQIGEQRLAVLGSLLARARHVDAAGIHDRGIDQPVDAFGKQCAIRGTPDFSDLVRIGQTRVDRKPSDRRRYQGHGCQQGIDLRANSKSHLGPPTLVPQAENRLPARTETRAKRITVP